MTMTSPPLAGCTLSLNALAAAPLAALTARAQEFGVHLARTASGVTLIDAENIKQIFGAKKP